jgi:hypothetical protein
VKTCIRPSRPCRISGLVTCRSAGGPGLRLNRSGAGASIVNRPLLSSYCAAVSRRRPRRGATTRLRDSGRNFPVGRVPASAHSLYRYLR